MKSSCSSTLSTATLLLALASAPHPVHAASTNTLVYCSEGNPELLNPQRTLSGTARNATATTIYERLVEFDRGTTRIVPGLAESWTVSADERTYTFRLRHGVQFHTTAWFIPSRELNADDVVFSFNRQLREDHPYHRVGGGTYPYFQGMGLDKLISAVERVAADEVQITLNRPEAPFLADLAMPFMSILSAEYADRLMQAGRPEELDTRPIGTGPYIFRSYQANSFIRYVANEQYWHDKARVANLVFSITPDPSVRLQKLRRNECQIAEAPAPPDLPAIRSDKHLLLAEGDGMNIGYLAMNVEKPPFNNVLVRQAIAHALNRQSYIRAIYLGTAHEAINVYPPTIWSYTDKVQTYAYDPARARALLAQAGYPHGFHTSLWTLPVSRPYNPNGRKMGEMMQADLAAVGIHVDLVTFDWGTYLEKVKRGEHEMVQLGWSGDNGDPDNFLHMLLSCEAVHRGSNNSRYCDPTFNSLISQARVVGDHAVRANLYRKALLQLSQDEPIIPIAHATVFRALNDRVVGYQINPFDMDYFSSVSLKDQ